MGGGKSKAVVMAAPAGNVVLTAIPTIGADDLVEDQAREAAAGGGGGGGGGGGINFDNVRAANLGNLTGLANPNVTEGGMVANTLMEGATKVGDVGQDALNSDEAAQLADGAAVLGENALAGAVNVGGAAGEGISEVVNSDAAAQLAEGTAALGEQALTGAANVGGAAVEGISGVVNSDAAAGVAAGVMQHTAGMLGHLHELGEAAAHVGEGLLHGGMELGGEIMHGGMELAHAAGDVIVPVLQAGGEVVGAVGGAVGSVLSAI